jgi:hypothetical protein
MAQTRKTRRVGDAGLGELSCFQANDPRIAPKPPSKQAQIAAVRRLRRQRLIEHLHRLGPAPLFHLLTDLDAGKPVSPTVERYAALPADFIRAYGGNKFAPFPLAN